MISRQEIEKRALEIYKSIGGRISRNSDGSETPVLYGLEPFGKIKSALLQLANDIREEDAKILLKNDPSEENAAEFIALMVAEIRAAKIKEEK